MLPNFLIIGAMKAGTTSLYSYLRAHPQVFMPAEKELHFFHDGENWSRGEEWYKAQFQDARDEIAIGEGTPAYSKFPEWKEVPRRIAGLIPDARLIYLLRHPIERMRSQYANAFLKGWEFEPIDIALRKNPVYLNASRYSMQIDQYLEYFSPDQFLIITTEDLRSDRQKTLRTVYQFLKVDPSHSSDAPELQENVTATKTVREPLRFALRQLPGGRFLGRHASERVKAPLRKALGDWTVERKFTPQRTEISAPVVEELVQTLREDVARLHRYVGNGFTGWGIA